MKTRRPIHHPLIAALTALLVPLFAFVAGVSTVVLTGPAAILPAAPVVSLESSRLTAKAAVLYDLTTQRVLYQKNANVQLPLASLTKLMAAEVVLRAKDPSSPVQITADALKPDGDWGFKPGETITLGELISFALVASSNDAIAAAAASLGPNYVAQMNLAAQSLGLSKTRFLNPTGLDVSNTVAGAYGSAYDVARLAAAFYKDHPALFAQTLQNKATLVLADNELSASATAQPLGSVPGVFGAKTGYTDLAGGNLVAVFDLDIGHPVVAVVLGSTRDGRFEDIKTLMEAARN